MQSSDPKQFVTFSDTMFLILTIKEGDFPLTLEMTVLIVWKLGKETVSSRKQ